jgi:hypothetical protein
MRVLTSRLAATAAVCLAIAGLTSGCANSGELQSDVACISGPPGTGSFNHARFDAVNNNLDQPMTVQEQTGDLFVVGSVVTPGSQTQYNILITEPKTVSVTVKWPSDPVPRTYTTTATPVEGCRPDLPVGAPVTSPPDPR